MRFFFVWDGKKIKQLSIIVIAAFFTAGLLFVERSDLMVFSTLEGPQAFYKAKTEDKKLALTFNISWGDQKAGPILDILKEKKITATFFLSAAWAEKHPAIVKRIVDEGHEIGNLGYRYESYPSWNDDKIISDIQRSHLILSELTGKKPTLLRPPHGHFDKRTIEIAKRLGYTIIHWSIDSKDYENPGVQSIIDNVLNHASNGDVILMHASDTVKQTEKALPVILDELTKQGYQFETVSELIASTTTNTEEIK